MICMWDIVQVKSHSKLCINLHLNSSRLTEHRNPVGYPVVENSTIISLSSTLQPRLIRWTAQYSSSLFQTRSKFIFFLSRVTGSLATTRKSYSPEEISVWLKVSSEPLIGFIAVIRVYKYWKQKYKGPYNLHNLQSVGMHGINPLPTICTLHNVLTWSLDSQVYALIRASLVREAVTEDYSLLPCGLYRLQHQAGCGQGFIWTGSVLYFPIAFRYTHGSWPAEIGWFDVICLATTQCIM